MIDTLYSLLAAVPSEIDTNLNNLNTSVPCSSETTHGVSGVCHWFMYQPIEFKLALLNLAAGL